jgi:hypothetical protein
MSLEKSIQGRIQFEFIPTSRPEATERFRHCAGSWSCGNRLKMVLHPKPSRTAAGLAVLLLIAACAGAPPAPRDPSRLCSIFLEYPDWRAAADRSRRRWGIPIPVMMAILYHESGFRSDARPPRTSCLWIFPGPRPSTAFGYPQALDSTWDLYRRKTGNRGADRDDFADAVDFVGWYCRVSHLECGIPSGNAYHLYLAYHEGWTGYRRGAYRGKGHVLSAARRVAATAQRYRIQMTGCLRPASRNRRPCLWFF